MVIVNRRESAWAFQNTLDFYLCCCSLSDLVEAYSPDQQIGKYLLRNDYAKSASQRRGFLLAGLTAAPSSIALVRLWESDE